MELEVADAVYARVFYSLLCGNSFVCTVIVFILKDGVVFFNIFFARSLEWQALSIFRN